jgi:hypothetical protein
MRPFSAAEILNMWERGAALHPIDRALMALNCAMPEMSCDALTKLPLGERDRCLLEVRQKNFGDRLEAYTECPNCRERLEFSLACSALLADTKVAAAERQTVFIDEVLFALRCPNSADAAAVASSISAEAGKETLLARCVESGDSGSVFTPAREAAIAAAFSELDPASEILLDLNCPACDQGWEALFEIEKFLWTELCARARRILQEVDALARVYHWTEAEITRMSESRRALYLQMALS